MGDSMGEHPFTEAELLAYARGLREYDPGDPCDQCPPGTDLEPVSAEDERTEFWMDWSRMAIAWGTALAVSLAAAFGMYTDGWIHLVMLAVVSVAAVAVVKLAWDAVTFVADGGYRD